MNMILTGRALLLVVRGQRKHLELTDGKQQRADARDPRQGASDESQKTGGRVGEILQHGVVIVILHRCCNCGTSTILQIRETSSIKPLGSRLAAAAKGPMTRLASLSAHRIRNGVEKNSFGPTTAAFEAATPKSARDRQRNEQHREQQPARA